MTSLKPFSGDSSFSIRPKHYFLEKLEIRIDRNLEANVFEIRYV